MTRAHMQIDRYRIERLLGEGGMGRVYLATDPKLNRDVAIKVLGSNVDARTRERFELEARAIAVLKHPNIVELYDYSGPSANDLFLVLEYVPGRNLYEYLLERGLLPEVVALCIGHELTLALCHAHRFKVVHRDIKPENVLLSRGRVVLADFGIIKVIEASEVLGVDDIASQTQTIGTPGFMAPEQLEGRKIDHRTDIFAVGAVLYNLATGQLPYAGEANGASFRRSAFIDPCTHVPGLSNTFASLLKRCVALKSKDRFDDPHELRVALLDALTEHGITEVRKVLEEWEADGTRPVTTSIAARQVKTIAVLQPWTMGIITGLFAGSVLTLITMASGLVPPALTQLVARVFR
ncbi:MAG: serine/threonine protein kinase [Clostridia bacterium]|nr:serine/threonine protein kinase [Deltaproteobacteria bacterium]